MVLAHQSVTLGERELCDLLDTQLAGTKVWNVLLLEQHVANCQVELDSTSFDRLQESLAAHVPPIALVVTRHLRYWERDTIHAVVVVGLTEDEVLVNDPSFPDAPHAIPRAEFWAAWSELDFLTVVVEVVQNGG
jgi:ABC-type bacteriocin/lantibiotic exporter with double-glycine peptidase domain